MSSRSAPPARSSWPRRKLARVEAAGGEILAQRAVEQRIAAGDQFVDGLGGDDQHGLARSAVNVWVCAEIAFEAERRDDAVRNRALGEAAGRDVDLDDEGFRHQVSGISGAVANLQLISRHR